jgi:hypothetical protein
VGRFPLGGNAVTGDTAATGTLAEENLVVEAGVDSARLPTPSGKDVSGSCARSLEHGARVTRCSTG